MTICYATIDDRIEKQRGQPVNPPHLVGTVWAMDIDVAPDFVRHNPRAVLTTYHQDGRAGADRHG